MRQSDVERRISFAKQHRDILIRAREAHGHAPMELLLDEDALPRTAEATSIVIPDQVRRDEMEGTLVDGMEGISKIEAGRPVESLSPRELAGTEAIVLLFTRPALLISNGTFLQVPEPWAVLNEHRSAIDHNITAVGRIDVEGHPDLDWIGTGFLVADDVVITARHVMDEFAQRDGAQWSISPGIQPSIDFLAEKTSITQARYEIVEVIAAHTKSDLALLRLGNPIDPGITKPTPLKLASSADVDSGKTVYVVGYPSMDSRRNEPAEMQRIFRRIYDVKRLQPGTVMRTVIERSEFLHDCSTLGGNSGSCVISLDTHLVIGLHFGGRYLRGNRAVNLPMLTADHIFKDLQASFA
jgi:V8-like Glu-specific endopeptidase